MTKTQLQAKNLGMTETAFIRRKIELNRQEHKILLRQLSEVNMIEYSDQKREGLFNGDGIDYIRMRADKHEKVYGDARSKKQAGHLRHLADELERYKKFYQGSTCYRC